MSAQPDGDKLVTLAVPGFPETEDREWKPSVLSLDERYAVSRSVGEECIQDSELRALLEKKDHPVCYDGFEPSGRMHIAQGVLRTVNVNKLTSAGAVFRFWVADWFAMLNSKMGGDLAKIQTVGKYFVEIWKSAGMDMTNVQFLWASHNIIANGDTYWLRVMDIARRTTIARTVKCCTIMGRQEKAGMPAAQILYPLMQCADIFCLKADICQLGMDQRKINMLARDYCDLIKMKFKPVIMSHHMLMGLKEGQAKMSKSDPESAIFMEDAAEDVDRKLAKAFCPEGEVEANPVLDYMKHIIFARYAATGVATKLADGQEKTFATYEELEAAFVAKQIKGEDLKTTLAKYLNEYVTRQRAGGGVVLILTGTLLCLVARPTGSWSPCASTLRRASPRSCWRRCARTASLDRQRGLERRGGGGSSRDRSQVAHALREEQSEPSTVVDGWSLRLERARSLASTASPLPTLRERPGTMAAHWRHRWTVSSHAQDSCRIQA